MIDRPSNRSDAFWLGVMLGIIHALTLATLLVLAWRTNAVMLMRRDQPPPSAAATL